MLQNSTLCEKECSLFFFYLHSPFLAIPEWIFRFIPGSYCLSVLPGRTSIVFHHQYIVFIIWNFTGGIEINRTRISKGLRAMSFIQSVPGISVSTSSGLPNYSLMVQFRSQGWVTVPLLKSSLQISSFIFELRTIETWC